MTDENYRDNRSADPESKVVGPSEASVMWHDEDGYVGPDWDERADGTPKSEPKKDGEK